MLYDDDRDNVFTERIRPGRPRWPAQAAPRRPTPPPRRRYGGTLLLFAAVLIIGAAVLFLTGCSGPRPTLGPPPVTVVTTDEPTPSAADPPLRRQVTCATWRGSVTADRTGWVQRLYHEGVLDSLPPLTLAEATRISAALDPYCTRWPHADLIAAVLYLHTCPNNPPPTGQPMRGPDCDAAKWEGTFRG